MKTDKEKGEEVLKERERARKGFAVTDDEGKDPLKGQKETQERIGDAGLTVDLGLKR